MKELTIIMATAILALSATACANPNAVLKSTAEATEAPATANAETTAETKTPADVNAGAATETKTPADANAGAAGTSAATISEDEAKKIALDHAGFTEDQVTFAWVHLDRDDGRTVYDVEFYIDLKEYDYEIDAASGEIVSYDYDMESAISANQAANGNGGSQGNQAPAAPNVSGGQDVTLTMDDAKSAALSHAGLSEGDVTFTETSFEFDDGIYEYQIDFISGTTEYEVEVDGMTGAIIGYDVESMFD